MDIFAGDDALEVVEGDGAEEGFLAGFGVGSVDLEALAGEAYVEPWLCEDGGGHGGCVRG